MKKEPKNFQYETAERIAEIFREGRQKRVLLSDEVGLGKIIIAKAVIEKVGEIRSSVNDDMYRVVYVCSNMNIVKQNAQNLGIDDVMNVNESRLTMQHLTLYEKLAKLKRQHKYREDGNYEDGEMPVLLIPLTPGTSFSLTRSYGNLQERALMFCMICLMPECSQYEDKLYDFFRDGVKEGGWNDVIKSYNKKIEKCGQTYKDTIHEALRAKKSFRELKNLLYSDNLTSEKRNLISEIRVDFALISLDVLEPDLVIMDEFQRFSSLLNDDADDEQSMISHKFFGNLNTENEDTKSPLILLLSATPYKPYTTLEELNENNVDEQYKDFYQLMDFMFKADKSETSFKKIWEDYSSELGHLSSDRLDILIAKKKKAEDKMYESICRTERLNENLITSKHVEEIPITEGDILSYCQMQRLLEDCKKKAEEGNNIHFSSYNIPIDYVKSCPYLLSFMDTYELKRKITDVYKAVDGRVHLPVNPRRQRYLLKTEHIYKYWDIAPNNARLEYLKKIIFDNHAERLLWIPASHPYYTTSPNNVFEKNKGFSKVLVFSAWEMVPRMLAVMLSYEAERLTIGKAFEDDNASYTNNTGRRRLADKNGKNKQKGSKNKSVIMYVCRYLSELYNPEEFYGQPIKDIRKELKNRLEQHIKERAAVSNINYSSADIYSYMKWLDNKGIKIKEFSRNALDILVNLAIGGPAECLYRILKDEKKTIALTDKFVTLFNRRQSAAIIDLIYERNSLDVYFEQVIDYCVMGNLQAVLDEFVHMIDESGSDIKGIYEHLNDSFIEMESGVNIDTSDYFAKYNENGKFKKWHMRTHFALQFTNAKVDQTKIKVANKTRESFNSPFRPFLLASTSVGQEGLDFHWYCRKIVHWNTPSNPQDLEQREGRINRYKCLAIRRNIAKLYPEIYSWNDMFDKAHEEMKARYNYSDMVPYWCLPPELIRENEDKFEMIERIVPMYPMSKDKERYERLISVLSLYRLTLGQPRQEELLNMLKGILPPEEIKNLLFNLSPYDRNNYK